MHIVYIKKKSGGVRKIYVPTCDIKSRIRKALKSGLNDKNNRCSEIGQGVCHGFVEDRSPVTNAASHVGYKHSLSFDLKDFFDSVTPEMVLKTAIAHLGKQLTAFAVEHCFPDGRAHQGPPSSPAMANIAALPMDLDILKLRKRGRWGWNFVYTRYADDLTFSYNSKDMTTVLLAAIPKIAERHGFTVNEKKTHLQSAKAGRRIITGVAVDDKVHVTREVKRKLRAALHQIKTGKLCKRNLRRLIGRRHEAKLRGKTDMSLYAHLVCGARGLAEWAKLKLPKNYTGQQAQIVPHIVSIPADATTTTVSVGYGRKLQ